MKICFKYYRNAFTPLEKTTDFNQWLYPDKANPVRKDFSKAVKEPLNSLTGFTLVEIMIVVAIIAIIIAIALPNYLKTSTVSKKTICINNLKQIDAAIDQWAMENDIPKGAQATEEVYDYVNGSRITCPSGGVYTLHSVGSKPQVTCSLENEGHKLPE
ncbi:MAG: prepilin-type N-terminal cleavage/methylation domain-containing protein [Candidatus Omnitrophica bacterium]|nr:prepilin-type N-terminal cleavage/methylation domain-containing protein [Candidatus Omnitrophota bacterium]